MVWSRLKLYFIDIPPAADRFGYMTRPNSAEAHQRVCVCTFQTDFKSRRIVLIIIGIVCTEETKSSWFNGSPGACAKETSELRRDICSGVL